MRTRLESQRQERKGEKKRRRLNDRFIVQTSLEAGRLIVTHSTGQPFEGAEAANDEETLSPCRSTLMTRRDSMLLLRAR